MQCPVCGRTVRLRRNGKIYPHVHTNDRDRCPASGQVGERQFDRSESMPSFARGTRETH